MALTALLKRPKFPYYPKCSAGNLQSEALHDEAAIVQQLEHPEEIELDDNGKMRGTMHRTFYNPLTVHFSWNMDGGREDGTVTFLAQPVLMALCVRRYDLVERLLAAGYGLLDSYKPDMEAIGTCYVDGKPYPFSIGQFIMGDPDMPDELRLSLWHQLARERKEYGKQMRRRRGKVIDFALFDFRYGDDFLNRLFQNPKDKENTFIRTFMHTLHVIAKRRPRYLKNIVDKKWRSIFSCEGYKYYRELALLFVQEVGVSESIRCRLFHMTGAPIDRIGEAELTKATEFLYKLKPFYQSERLKQALLECALNIYLRYQTGNMFGRTDSRAEKTKDKLVRLLRRCNVKALSLADYLAMYKNGDIVFSDWFAWLLKTYKALTGRKVVFDDSIVVIELENLPFQDSNAEGDRYVVSLNGQTDWVEYVEVYAYADDDTLSSAQEYILKTCGQDLLMFALRRGLFKGKQFETAIDYCMKDPELQLKIPCLLASRR